MRFAALLLTIVLAGSSYAGIFNRSSGSRQAAYTFVVQDGQMVSGCCRNGSRCWMMQRAMTAAAQGATHVRINGVEHPIVYRNTRPPATPTPQAVSETNQQPPTKMVQVPVQKTVMQTQKYCVNGRCYTQQVPVTKTVYEWRTVPIKPVVIKAAPKQKKVIDISYEFDPTPDDAAKLMVAMARVKAGDKVYDLGCGDGRLLEESAKSGATCIGVEINPQTVQLARKRLKGIDNARVIEGDIFDADFDDADVVFLYLWPDVITDLAPRLFELRPGTRVISYLHDIPDACTFKHQIGDHTFFSWVVGSDSEPEEAEPLWQQYGIGG